MTMAMVKLGDVCEVIAGQSPEGRFYNSDGIGTPFYQGKKEFGDRQLGAPSRWTTSVTKLAEDGDILMSVRAPVGPVNVCVGIVCIGRGLAAVRPGDRVNRDFLFHQLQAMEREIAGTEGAVFASINKSQIEEIEIYLPELEEQERLVDVLEQTLQCRSRLLADNIAEATSLKDLERSLTNDLFFTIKAEKVALSSACELFTDGDWIESKDQSTTGIRLVQTGNIGAGFFKDRREKARWISSSKFDDLRCTEVLPGDVLFSRLPDPVGRSCVVPDTGDRMITAVDCTIARSNPDRLVNQFLVLYTMTDEFSSQVREKITGATRDRISRSNLGELRVPCPSLDVQRDLIARVDESTRRIRELTDLGDEKRRSLEDLRVSVLQTAFRGEL